MERPILFSTEMVRAILAGRKTQTRRVIKLQPDVPVLQEGEAYTFPLPKCPYGSPGDLLYVREGWQAYYNSFDEWGMEGMEVPIWWHELTRKKVSLEEKLEWKWTVKYKEDEHSCSPHPERWLPSIHMPKKFARIWLRVKDVRVERLNDITAEDCWAEGIDLDRSEPLAGDHVLMMFEELWDSINKKRGFGVDTNPWVWVVEFKKIEK